MRHAPISILRAGPPPGRRSSSLDNLCTLPDLILRSPLFAGVSKDGPQVCALEPSFETHRFAMLLRMRSAGAWQALRLSDAARHAEFAENRIEIGDHLGDLFPRHVKRRHETQRVGPRR